MPSEIKNCDCKSDYQDKKYGQGKRVHNIGKKGGNKSAKCTVCAKIK